MRSERKTLLFFRFTLSTLLALFIPEVEGIEQNYVNPQKGSSSTYSLADIIDIAKENNPALMLAKAQIERQDGILSAARSNFYPDLELSGDTTLGRLSRDSFEESQSDRSIRLALVVDQKLYTGGRNEATYKKAKALKKAAQKRTLVATNHLLFRIKESYYRYLTTNLNIKIGQDHLFELEKELKQETSRINAGLSPRLYGIRLAQSIAKAKGQIRDLKLASETSKELVFELAGLPLQGREAELKDALPGTYSGSGIEQLLTMAKENRPEYARFRELIGAASNETRTQRSKSRPDVSLFASYGFDQRYSDTDSSDYKPDWNVGISAKWKLFDSGETRGLVKAAKAEEKIRRLQFREFEQGLKKEITIAWQRQQEAIDQKKYSKGIAKQATSALSQVKQRRQIGKASQLEVLEAQTNLMEAKLLELDASHKLAIAKVLIEKAVAANILDYRN